MGVFITIDGIDGAGKTTLANGLAARLFGSFGLNVLLTKEPTSRSPWAKKLRAAALTERMSKELELEYFHRDRLWHLKNVIFPALKQEQVVICDRFIDSTLAYQCTNPSEADVLFKKMSSEVQLPDITFILDCPVEVSIDRISKRNQPITSFEKSETLKTAREIFRSRVGTHYRHLDGTKPPQDVLAEAISEISPMLPDAFAKSKKRPKSVVTDPNSSSFSLLPAVA